MDKIQAIIFYIVALTAIVGAFRAVFTKKIFYSVLYAFLCFMAVGLLFFALELPYLGVVQLSLCGAKKKKSFRRLFIDRELICQSLDYSC